MTVRPTPVLSCRLVRKRCACGAQATAKQLIQYGKCARCFKAQVQAATTQNSAVAR